MSAQQYIENSKKVKLRKLQAQTPGFIPWEVSYDGKMLGTVIRTGEYGRDTCPWDWQSAESNLTGVEATRKEAVAQLVAKTTGEVVWL